MNKYEFWIDDFATELKQHINLSKSAWRIVEDDMNNFYESREKISFSGFLNTVLENFVQDSTASISLRLKQKKEELELLKSNIKFKSYDKKTLSTFIQTLLSVFEHELTEKSHSYINGSGKKFRINKNNLDLIRESEEAPYYEGNIGKYLKAIFEEYSQKHTYEREQIFFKSTIKSIEEAIVKQKKLKITLNDKTTVLGDRTYNKKYYVYPYKIVQNSTYTYNYLVGFAEEILDIEQINEDGSKVKTREIKEKIPCCFRISRIKKCDVQTSMGAKISKPNVELLENLIDERTVMFLSSEPIEAKIKFSQKGLESFKRQLYMRPTIYTVDSNNEYVYNFYCTEIQLINYFFKFGWDIEVLEPLSLRNTFIKRYKNAVSIYDGKTKEDIIFEQKNHQ